MEVTSLSDSGLHRKSHVTIASKFLGRYPCTAHAQSLMSRVVYSGAVTGGKITCNSSETFNTLCACVKLVLIAYEVSTSVTYVNNEL
jgi:hypothetical protein